MNTIIAFIVIFGALVFFHELGHLYFAKRAGILCREFAIGFGPKVFSFTRNETVYTIRLLPLGGFVRMAGEDPEAIEVKPGYNVGLIFDENDLVKKIIINNKSKHPEAKIVEVEHADLEKDMVIRGYEDEDGELQTYRVHETSFFVVDENEIQVAPYDRQFRSKTIGQRTIAIFAGPAMNFILAFVILTLLAFMQGYPVEDAMLGKLTEDGAANEAGLRQGDRVVQIDGREVDTWEGIVEIVQQSAGEPLDMMVERNGETLQTNVTPKPRELEDGTEIGIIGVYPPMEKSAVGSIQYGAEETYFWTKTILVGLGKLVTGQFSIDMLSGPVGIYSVTDEVAQSGIYNLMRWGALLSINLGIVNLLPLPALDGGRLLFFLIEGIRGKPVDPQKEGLVHFIGFAFLMLLMIVVTWNDIQKFFL
ncbi:RIP metalloprotease RseP [Bacillus marinisedimentorum]|uniref:RIP metalloprotease RseP n=1 Tax=Bacillus marinisedimentorum TaxID=1821260 RepID=UPI0007E2831D|nr:RIP metalloprotease RseP [Bacillus marinisedimentorum]